MFVTHLKFELNFVLKSSSETWKVNRVSSTKVWAFFDRHIQLIWDGKKSLVIEVSQTSG